MERYTQKEISEYCRDSYSYADVLRKMQLDITGNNYRKLKNRIKKYQIDISHFCGARWQQNPHLKDRLLNCGGKEKWDLDEILCENSPVTQKVLRGYIRRHNVIPYECQKCKNNGVWQNESLSLELDHIDGDDHNNRPENLRYLCPNCHSQTNTFRGKNKALRNQNKKAS